MHIVLVSGDLMVMSRVAGAASQPGHELTTVADDRTAIESCQNRAAAMLIVDLSTPSLNVAELVAGVKRCGGVAPIVIAFGPHVHEEKLAAARDAGCDRVLSRGQFLGQLDALLQV